MAGAAAGGALLASDKEEVEGWGGGGRSEAFAGSVAGGGGGRWFSLDCILADAGMWRFSEGWALPRVDGLLKCDVSWLG